MRKILKFLASFLPVLLIVPAVAFATVVDSCGQTFVYTKNSDFNDSRVVIDFTNTPASGNPDTITISAQSGYQVIAVELDVEGDGAGGFQPYATGPITDFNPNPGQDIDGAKVTVKKTCPDVCPNIEGEQYEVPEGYVVEEGQCVLPPPPPVDVCANLEGVQESVPEGYVQNGENCDPVPPPTDLCANIEGVQATVPEGYHQDGENCVQDTPPVDVCPNIDGDQASVPEGKQLVDGQCVDIPTPPPSTGSGSQSQTGGSGAPGGASVWRRLCNVSGFCVLNPDPNMAPIMSQLLDIWMTLFKIQSSLK